MLLTPVQTLIMILAVAAATFFERALPFIVFSGKKPVPEAVKYLGRALPPAMAGLLMVYCLKSASFLPGAFDWEMLAGLAAIAGLHAWRHNTMLSVFGGTAVYMLLLYAF